MWTHHRAPRYLAITAGVALFAFFWIILGGSVRADSLSFSGKVTTPTGGTYTGGGWVNMYNATNGQGGSIDEDGDFEVSNLQPGEYTLELSIPSSSGYASPAQQKVGVTANVQGFSLKLAVPAVKGILSAPSGTPTDGCVNLHDPTWTINRNSCPGSDGVFVLGDLKAGTYTLDANPPQNSDYVQSQQTVTITDPATTQDLGAVKLDSPFVVGIVAYPNGTPVPWDDDWNKRVHLSVDLWNNDRTIDRHSDYDKNSKFKFGKIPAGDYTVRVNVWDTVDYTSSAEVKITVSDTGLDMTATPIKLSTPQVAGTVYDTDGSTTLQNVCVNVHTDDWSLNQNSCTDSKGQYRIGGLPDGTYKIEAGAPFDRPDLSRYGPVDITVTSSLTTKNITFSKASKFITGTVKTKNGTPVTCANINANLRGGNGWAGTQAKSDGTFTLAVAPGAWGVRVEPINGWDCTADWVYLEPEVVVVFSEDSSSQTENITLTVEKATATIKGVVKTKSGVAITNGNVNANAQLKDGKNIWSNAQIKADGSYELRLKGGTYELNMWTNDRRLYAKNQKVTVADNETVTANFTMSEKLAHITGAVTDKSGKGLPNVRINGNADCEQGGCSGWSDTTTDTSGNFDLAVTSGLWNLNFDSGQGLPYVYGGQPIEVNVPSDTATVSGITIALTYADATVKGKVVDKDGKTLPDTSGWVYARPATVTADSGWREYGGSVNGGKFEFRLPSSLLSQAELGMHMPPNSSFTATPVTITLVADATVEQNITILENDAAIVGRLQDSSGLPLSKCPFRGEVFANAEDNQWHGTQINPDCTFEISIRSGTYRLGYHVEESSGLLNAPPKDDKVNVPSGARVEWNPKVLVGDATVKVLVLKPDGTPVDGHMWVWGDNHKSLDEARKSGEAKEGAEQFRGPGDTKSPEEVLKYCSDKKNEKECADFKLPAGAKGPGGCGDALACTLYCEKNKEECEKEFKGGDPTKDVKAKSAVTLSSSVLRQKAKIASLRLVKAQGEAGDDAGDDVFDNYINSGADAVNGVATLNLISGFEYTIGAGLPPEQKDYIPPKFVDVDLRTQKTTTVTLQLRKSDGRMSGFVTYNGKAVRDGWVNGWCEDGSNMGGPIYNGAYQLNYAFNSACTLNANASDGTTFLHSGDQVVTIGTQKKTTLHFTLDKADFDMPPDVSETFDATTPHVISLADGTTVNIPANTLATSGNVTVTASPTINVQSQKTYRVGWYAYNFIATDADGKELTTFNGNVTACFKYSDQLLADANMDEGAIVPSYWDETASAWKTPSNITQDKDADTVCVTTNHFTPYALVGTSGKSKSLTTVKTSTSKGITKIKIGSGNKTITVTPFPKYKGEVSIATDVVSKKGGQIILAVPKGKTSEATTVKVYSVKGKVTQKMTPWGSGYRSGGTVTMADLTGDGQAEGVFAPTAESTVHVTDFAKKANFRISAGAGGAVIAQPLDLLGRGDAQLAVARGTSVTTWKYGGKKKGFQKFSYDARRLSVKGTSIEKVVLQPTVRSVSPNTVSTGKKGTVTFTITGTNFGDGSRVLLNQEVAAKKVTASGETTLTATFEKSKIPKKKKYTLTIINPDGAQVAYSLKAK